MQPVVISIADAPQRVLALAAAAAKPAGQAAVIGVTGRVGAGKSTLAARLSVCVLSTDDYLPDYDKVPEAERDDPRHADFSTLLHNVEQLQRGSAARVPVWSFHTHRREGVRLVTPADVIVIEGIHALHGALRAAMQVRVFVEAARATRWERWEHLERTGVRGWGVEKARVFFDGVAEPTFARWEAEYREAAHVVVMNG
jgi:uridine kinase